MSWLKKTFGGGNPVASAVVETAKGVADIVERWAPSDAAKHAMYMDVHAKLTEAVNAARSYDPRSPATRAATEFINVVVDAANRMIRPGLAILTTGAVFGWWRVETSTLDPIVLAWAEGIGMFYFGIRAITRDIPSLIKMLVELKRGAK